MMRDKLDMFLGLTGAGVKIGVIDSGYVPSRINANVVGGINLSNGVSNLHDQADYTDSIGHGTACSGILARKAPEAEIYAVKIFDRELISDVDRLCAGIRWCVDQRLHIANLSLGTTKIENRKQIQDVCDFALQQGLLIVAATSNDGQESFPAVLPEIFGVMAGKIKGRFDFFYDKHRPVQFVANGDKQRLDWIDGKQAFSEGSSYACPHVSAILALLLQKFPGMGMNQLDKKLTALSLTEEPVFVSTYTPAQTNALFAPQNKKKLRISDFQPDISWIKRAVIYPYNKEMHGLIRFRSLLPFEIVHVVDLIGKRMVGKDSGEVIGAPPSGIAIKSKIEPCLNDVDTIILSHLDEISRIRRKDVLKEVLDMALRHNKHVYSLGPVAPDMYGDEIDQFRQKNLYTCFPEITPKMAEDINGVFDQYKESHKPVLGVFGTGSQQGKFTLQLILREALQKRGYKVGQLGTEHQSALFGFDFTFPNGYSGSRNIHIPMEQHISFLQSVMTGLEAEDPDIIVVGGQSGVVPYSYALKSPHYTLLTLMLLLGTLPDAYILVINSTDEMEYIQETIQVIEGLGKGKVIFLAVSKRKKVYQDRFGKAFLSHETLHDDEIEALVQKVENRFHLAAADVMSQEGLSKMICQIENFFSDG